MKYIFFIASFVIALSTSSCNYQRSKMALTDSKPLEQIHPASFARIQADLLVGGSCFNCHGPGASSGIELYRYEDVMNVVEPFEPEKSLFFEKLESQEMPPGKRPKVTGELLDSIKKWISEGAKND